MKYSQACPEVTFRELEEAFRGENFRVHLIAMVRTLEQRPRLGIDNQIGDATNRQQNVG